VGHPRFPHETTGDQFYAEDQFESYRRLGAEVTCGAFDAAIAAVGSKDMVHLAETSSRPMPLRWSTSTTSRGTPRR
jgi:hypothetical protein